MTEMIEQYLRLGLVHFMAFPVAMQDERLLVPTLEQVAADPAFRCVELKFIENGKLIGPVHRVVRSAGLGLGLAAQPAMLAHRLDPGSPDKKDRQRALDVLKAHLDQALILEAESLTLLSGPDPARKEERRECLARTADLLAELCALSRSQNGPSVVLEVFDREVDKKALVGPARVAARLCELMDQREAENFGVLVDLSHLPLLGESPMEALEPVSQHLVAAHLGNAVTREDDPAYGDQHPGFGHPFGANGIPQVRDFLHALKSIGFLKRRKPPMVSFEVKPAGDEKPEWVVACAKRVLLRAWALI